MPNQNTFLYPPLTFRILAVAILACLFLVPKTMADTKDQEYIVLISSSTFREKWAYDLLETVEKAFNEENSVKVYSETLTTWHFNSQQEIDQKVDYLKDKYSVPPQAVIFVGDPGWYVCKPLFDTIWRGVPTIICHSMPHTPADINKYYEDGIRAINDIPDGEELLPEAQRILSEEVEAPVLQEVMAEQGRVQEILGNMTGVLQDYLIEVQGYDALSYLEQEKIAEQMSSIYRTVQDMQTEIVDHDSEYRAYIVDVTTTTDENIDMLKESLDQSYDQTKSNVNHTVELLKDNRTTLNEQNVAVLEDITKKLPYTRLGNLEYLQVYDLISQPVVEDDQALENIQIRKTTVTLEWQDMVVGWIGIAALIVIDAAVQFIYKKRMRDLHSGKEGEIWQVE